MNELINYRREFHRFAESAWNEVRTSARVAEILANLGLDANVILLGDEAVDFDTVKPPLRPTHEVRDANVERAVRQGARRDLAAKTDGIPGVVAIIDSGRPGPTWALRFDVDCLPYDEDSSSSHRPRKEGFASVNPGCVHACGHDAHTAIGLGLAARLLADLSSYRGKIKLIFQPAEESFFGAASIVARGHLDDVEKFAAVHLALSAANEPLPSHSLACAINDFLSVRQLDVTFRGKAAHPCGASQEGRNALLAACSAALNLHCIAPHEKGLARVNVGKISGGLCSNTIADECKLTLEYRGQFPEISEYLRERVFAILDGSAASYGASYTYTDYGEFPAAASDRALAEEAAAAAASVPWFETVYPEGNLGGSDDASVMMNHVQKRGGQAVYLGIGCDVSAPVHNPAFDFDESCLEPTVSLLAEMIKRG